MPLSTIQPDGWLREWLKNQSEGLTGHIEEAGAPFDSVFWGVPPNPETLGKESWVPFEQTAYWIDGAIRCGCLLGDTTLIERAQSQIRFALDHADADGYIGHPDFKNGFRWSHTVFFRACIALHSATGAPSIPEKIRLHYVGDNHPHSKERDVTNIEIMLWAFEKTGDGLLLEKARRAFEENSLIEAGHDCSLSSLLSDKCATEHGVTFNEQAKLGAILYSHTGDARHLEASLNGFRKLDRDQILASGIPSSSEHLRGKDPLDSYEVCDIADYTWSAGHLLRVTGDAAWADRIERACFNAAPGAVTHDFRALQYFSCPNQVISTGCSNHNLFFRGEPWMSYRPNPGTACCPGNVNRIFPNFASLLWMRDRNGGIVSAMYAPSTYRGPLADGIEGAITLDTAYPFEETVSFRFDLPKAVAFPFTVRIPGWCNSASLCLNGQPLKERCLPGSFVTLKRTFQPGDVLELLLPMNFALRHWPLGGVSLDYGPLVFALDIREKWQVDAGGPKGNQDERFQSAASRSGPAMRFPNWEIHPDTPWNFALALDVAHFAKQIRIERRPLSGNPWTQSSSPIRLHLPARRVRGWEIDQRKEIEVERYLEVEKGVWRMGRIHQRGDYAFTPQLPDPAELPDRLESCVETVTLVPFGCTRLRLSIFPFADNKV